MLSNAESMVAPVIRKLTNPHFKMNDRHRSELYSFVALTFVRVPAYREFIDIQAAKMMKSFAQSHARDPKKFYATVGAYEAETGQSLGDHEKLREFAASDNYSLTQQSTGFNLLLTFQSCIAISEILDTDGKAWVGMGIGRRRTEVRFPLNKRACLILSRNGQGRQVSASAVRSERINDVMMGVAQKYA